MDSLWKISKEESPLANGLLERQASKKDFVGDAPRLGSKQSERLERKKERHPSIPDLGSQLDRAQLKQLKEGEPERDWDLLRRVERLLDDHSQRELCRVEDMISSAVGRVGDAFRGQVEALRRDFSRLQSRQIQDSPDVSNVPGSQPSTARTATVGAGTSRGTSPAPEAVRGGLTPALRSALEEQRLRAESQISGLLARVNALQQALSEVVLEQELHHIATGKFACTVGSFSSKEKEASVLALNGREAAARERLRKLRKPSKTAAGLRHPGHAAEGGDSECSSVSGVSVATTSPATVPHIYGIGRPGILEEDETSLVELLPTDRGAAAAASSDTWPRRGLLVAS